MLCLCSKLLLINELWVVAVGRRKVESQRCAGTDMKVPIGLVVVELAEGIQEMWHGTTYSSASSKLQAAEAFLKAVVVPPAVRKAT